MHKDGRAHFGTLGRAHPGQDHRVYQHQVDGLPNDFIAYISAEPRVGERPEDEPQREPCTCGCDPRGPSERAAIGDEFQTPRNYYLALLGMAEHANLVTTPQQFARDAKHRRDVAATVPCDD
jgi:hypothetical protein